MLYRDMKAAEQREVQILLGNIHPERIKNKTWRKILLPDDYIQLVIERNRVMIRKISEELPCISELQRLILEVDEMEQEKKQLPEGHLERHRRGDGTVFYSYQFSFRRQRYEKYIRVGLLGKMFELFDKKKLLEDKIRIAKKKIRELLEIFSASLKTERRRAMWTKREKEKTFNYPHPEQYTHRTLRGEFVASKAEVVIADHLFLNGIDYEYSKELVLDGMVFHPDFTIKIGKKVFYLEHLGMLEDENYLHEWLFKLSVYIRNGIIPGETLLITRDYHSNIDMYEIDLMLRKAGVIKKRSRRARVK